LDRRAAVVAKCAAFLNFSLKGELTRGGSLYLFRLQLLFFAIWGRVFFMKSKFAGVVTGLFIGVWCGDANASTFDLNFAGSVVYGGTNVGGTVSGTDYLGLFGPVGHL
jgi:hypothetical protein